LRAEDLQTRSHKVACVARLLAEETAFADEAFLAGMLHEIGYLVLAQECGAELAAILADSERTGRPLVELEYERFGASHAEIGAYLLGLWGLPYSLVEAVARHHTPSRVQQTDFDVLGVLVLAEALCDGPPGEPGLDLEEYLARLKAPYDMNEARRRASTVFEVPVGNPA
jgi:HD-like signal output (HDOD) protein